MIEIKPVRCKNKEANRNKKLKEKKTKTNKFHTNKYFICKDFLAAKRPVCGLSW